MKRFCAVILILFFALCGCGKATGIAFECKIAQIAVPENGQQSYAVLIRNYIQKYDFIYQEKFSDYRNTEIRLVSAQYNATYFTDKDLIIIYQVLPAAFDNPYSNNIKKLSYQDNMIAVYFKADNRTRVNPAIQFRMCFIEINKQPISISDTVILESL